MNFEILDKIQNAGSKVVVVTKYFDEAKTKGILKVSQDHPAFLALGENRIKDLENKNLPPEKVHFIGNLQSRDLSHIVQSCSAIHSLYQEKHAQILNDLEFRGEIFLQINISREPQKGGVLPDDFASMLQKLKALHLNIAGISAIGEGEFTAQSKSKEFKELKSLRDQYLPNGKISAGTSRDWEIALEERIEIVRIGQALFN